MLKLPRSRRATAKKSEARKHWARAAEFAAHVAISHTETKKDAPKEGGKALFKKFARKAAAKK